LFYYKLINLFLYRLLDTVFYFEKVFDFEVCGNIVIWFGDVLRSFNGAFAN